MIQSICRNCWGCYAVTKLRPGFSQEGTYVQVAMEKDQTYQCQPKRGYLRQSLRVETKTKT